MLTATATVLILESDEQHNYALFTQGAEALENSAHISPQIILQYGV